MKVWLRGISESFSFYHCPALSILNVNTEGIWYKQLNLPYMTEQKKYELARKENFSKIHRNMWPIKICDVFIIFEEVSEGVLIGDPWKWFMENNFFSLAISRL